MGKTIGITLMCSLALGCEKGSQGKAWYESAVCVESSKVVEIESIIYRGGYVRLENGQRINVRQRGPVSVGSDWCVRYSH